MSDILPLKFIDASPSIIPFIPAIPPIEAAEFEFEIEIEDDEVDDSELDELFRL